MTMFVLAATPSSVSAAAAFSETIGKVGTVRATETRDRSPKSLERDDDDGDDFFAACLTECLKCGGVYQKVAPARYVRDGDDEGRHQKRPCFTCRTKDNCIMWRGGSPSSKQRKGKRLKRAFQFDAGLVVRCSTRSLDE